MANTLTYRRYTPTLKHLIDKCKNKGMKPFIRRKGRKQDRHIRTVEGLRGKIYGLMTLCCLHF